MKIADVKSKERSSQMSKTMNLKWNSNNDFLQAVDCYQSLHFCVHIFDEMRDRIVESI